MARNKYPQETVRRILDTARRLFLEKGYDNTTVQDIVDGLGGLSKGAIYHHFRSKEDILRAVCSDSSQAELETLTAIRDDPDLTGREKLECFFARTLQAVDQVELMRACPPLVDNPRLLADQLRDTLYVVAPEYVAPVLRQGVADGSLQTDCPEELAQMILVLSNLWLNPIVYPMSRGELERKLRLFVSLLNALGLDVIAPERMDTLLQKLQSLCREDRPPNRPGL